MHVKSGNIDDFISYLNVMCLTDVVYKFSYSTFDKALYRYTSREVYEFTSLRSKFIEVYVCQNLSQCQQFWQSYCKNKMVQLFGTQCSLQIRYIQGGPKNAPLNFPSLLNIKCSFLTKQYKILNCYSFAVKPYLSCNFISTKSTVIRS